MHLRFGAKNSAGVNFKFACWF